MSNVKKASRVEFVGHGLEDSGISGGPCERWFSFRSIYKGLLLSVILAILAGGCASEKIIKINDYAEFEKKVIQSPKPVLVEFYKQGCPTCVVLESNLNKLAEEYEGRVLFVKFELMSGVFVPQCPELKEKYNLRYLFPTALLLVNGQEKQRWILKYDMDSYRMALDKVTGAVKK